MKVACHLVSIVTTVCRLRVWYTVLCQKCQFCLVRIIITLYSLRVFFLIISWSAWAAWVHVYSFMRQLCCQVHIKCISSVCQCMSSVCQVHVKYISSVCQLVSIKRQYDGGTKCQFITHARVVCRTRVSLTVCHTFHVVDCLVD